MQRCRSGAAPARVAGTDAMKQIRFHMVYVVVLMATVDAAADEPLLPPKARLVLPVREPPKRENQSQEKSQRATQPPQYGISRHATATVEDAYRVFAAMAREHGRIPPQANTDD